jgi:kinesin family protein 3/17
MMGPDPNDPVDAGIIPRSFQHIFKIIENTKDKKFLVRCTYIEIYNDQIRDLLSNDQEKRLSIHESPKKGIFIKGILFVESKGIKVLLKAMHSGNKNRHTGSTAMNATSSRSHSIFTLYIETQET